MAAKNKARKKKRISKHVLDAQKSKDSKDIPPKKKKEAAETKQKDPHEASNYLKLWKDHKAAWKFNKNTQSWLIRHMYAADHVNKTTFGLLLEYLREGPEVLATRILHDARRRALRYKDFEKQKEEQAKPSGAQGEETKISVDEAWDKLDDHGKRKEYKRARKVIDLFE